MTINIEPTKMIEKRKFDGAYIAMSAMATSMKVSQSHSDGSLVLLPPISKAA